MKTKAEYYADRQRRSAGKIARAQAAMLKAERALKEAQQRRRAASGLQQIQRAMVAEDAALRAYRRAYDKLSVARGF